MLKSPKGRLTAEGVAHVRQLRADGKTYQQISGELAVSITTVYNICTGRTRAED